MDWQASYFVYLLGRLTGSHGVRRVLDITLYSLGALHLAQ